MDTNYVSQNEPQDFAAEQRRTAAFHAARDRPDLHLVDTRRAGDRARDGVVHIVGRRRVGNARVVDVGPIVPDGHLDPGDPAHGRHIMDAADDDEVAEG